MFDVWLERQGRLNYAEKRVHSPQRRSGGGHVAGRLYHRGVCLGRRSTQGVVGTDEVLRPV